MLWRLRACTEKWPHLPPCFRTLLLCDFTSTREHPRGERGVRKPPRPPVRKCLQSSWGNRNSRRQKVVSAGGDTQPGPQNKTGVTHLGSVAGSAVSWLRDHGAHMSIELACVQSPLWSWSGTGFGKWWPMSRIWPTTMLLCGLIAKNSSYTFKWLVAGNQRNILCHMKIV